MQPTMTPARYEEQRLGREPSRERGDRLPVYTARGIDPAVRISRTRGTTAGSKDSRIVGFTSLPSAMFDLRARA